MAELRQAEPGQQVFSLAEEHGGNRQVQLVDQLGLLVSVNRRDVAGEAKVKRRAISHAARSVPEMIGPILLCISWVLLRLEGQSLRVLGFDFPAQRLREFSLGLLVTGFAALIQQLGFGWSTGDGWRVNPALTGELTWRQLRWAANSVVFEELMFRGYLLYQAIRFFGERRGVWLSALAFGIYHWFTFGVLGNPVAMGYVLLLTGAFGGMCALAFAKTKSLAAPLGLHLGWNLISYVVFSAGPAGAALLIPGSGAERMKATGLSGVLFGFGLQLALSALVIIALVRRPAPTSEFQSPPR